jgi:hypothetical protein
MTPHWWTDVDHDVLSVLRDNGAMAPGDVASRIGVSEDAATSLLSMLAREGKVRIRLVECAETRPAGGKPAGPVETGGAAPKPASPARRRPAARKPHAG